MSLHNIAGDKSAAGTNGVPLIASNYRPMKESALLVFSASSPLIARVILASVGVLANGSLHEEMH